MDVPWRNYFIVCHRILNERTQMLLFIPLKMKCAAHRFQIAIKFLIAGTSIFTSFLIPVTPHKLRLLQIFSLTAPSWTGAWSWCTPNQDQTPSCSVPWWDIRLFLLHPLIIFNLFLFSFASTTLHCFPKRSRNRGLTRRQIVKPKQ